MRLDRFLSESGLFTRREAVKAIRGGLVTVDGEPVRDPSLKIDENAAAVEAAGRRIGYTRFRWIMLNKPADTVSTTDGDPRSVLNLLPAEYRSVGLFPCGRLDADTTGLLILTSDGATAHNLLSPRRHCEKVYRFSCLPITEEERVKLEAGVDLSDFTSKPCRVTMADPEHGEIAVTEGKYHQIKRMFLAVGSEILSLERISFGGIPLDPTLARGEWRLLTEEEIGILETNGGQDARE